MSKIGDSIKDFRQKRGLTQRELAKLVGASFSTLRRWEVYGLPPRADEVTKLAAALGVSEAELLNGPEEQEWTLNIRIKNIFEEEIDMAEGGCISNLDLTRKGAALTVGADYSTFEDDGKFEHLMDQIREARNFVIENGKKLLAGALPVGV